MKKSNLKNVIILLVDSDACLARATIYNLRTLGFTDVTHVKSVDMAIKTMRSQLVTLCITEWDMETGNTGIELIQYVRTNPELPSRALPVIMLTGRGELADVQYARDMGVTEFVVKPFTSRTLFSRLEQVVDSPRDFVVSAAFVGPERRRKKEELRGIEERRLLKSTFMPFSREAMRQKPGATPHVFGPDTSLRETLGLSAKTKLAALIPPETLKEAQKAIDSLSEDSLIWIKNDLKTLKKNFEIMTTVHSAKTFEKVKQSTLSIKSRSGTFGYTMASEVARLLFIFLTRSFIPMNAMHSLVISKHIEVLTLIFAKKILVREGLGAELYIELERLISAHK